jgi:hypothetical protein
MKEITGPKFSVVPGVSHDILLDLEHGNILLKCISFF